MEMISSTRGKYLGCFLFLYSLERFFLHMSKKCSNFAAAKVNQ